MWGENQYGGDEIEKIIKEQGAIGTSTGGKSNYGNVFEIGPQLPKD